MQKILSASFSRVLITGASGRLGSNLAKRLTEVEGVAVRSFLLPDDPAEIALENVDTEKVYGDIRDEDAVDKALDGVDAVLHCAAVMGAPRGGMTDHQFFDINVRGTFNVFHGAAKRADRIRKIVYVSSTAAYDVHTAGPVIREDHPLRPLHLYGLTKATAEVIARTTRFQSGIPVVILRPNYIMACDEILSFGRAGVVVGMLRGAARDPRTTLYTPEATDAAVKAAIEAVDGDLSRRCVPRTPGGRSWTWHVTDVRDCAQAALRALDRDAADGQVFNVAGPTPLHWDVDVPYLCSKLGEEYVEVPTPALWHFEFDLSRARKILGYAPEYTPQRMIDDALAWKSGEDIGVIPPAIPH